MKNICDFGFTPEEEVTVLRGAEIFKATVQGRPPIDIENAFDLAKALRVLKEHNYGGGGQGAYKRALVQYGFVNRHGEAISPSIRSDLENLLKNETAARKWWDKVPEHERYGWTSPVTIAKAWVKSTKPEIEEEDEADGLGAVNKTERDPPQDDPASWIGAQACVDRLIEFAGFALTKTRRRSSVSG